MKRLLDSLNIDAPTAIAAIVVAVIAFLWLARGLR
jgi:hypothetical protein